ncbi:MAG: 16S rRNA (uracil(1498)-N(3))-methyltransferase [Lewinellaceae bacterium]|nr:16S rRNA (uracil(1498)-N(3))-methyltransferase [Lewinellaceae bacterium]
MQLFFCQNISNGLAYFDEEESRHLLSVLRHKAGDTLRITDGRGNFYDVILEEGGKKKAVAKIVKQEAENAALHSTLHIAMAPTKQIERFEWFLEKATEIGIASITPILCARSERKQIRHDRLEKVLVSAMKQSLRATLPALQEITPFSAVVKNASEEIRCIAWCDEHSPRTQLTDVLQSGKSTLVLIGPEGDFSPEEVALAEAHGFIPVSLGEARLRTETAGLYVAVKAAIV